MADQDATISGDALPAGTSLQGGNFLIESLIAISSFGTTYLAQDTVLSRHVVIKEYFPEGCRRENGQVIPHRLQGAQSDDLFIKVRDKFLGEARALARFHHPGIVAVHSFFEANNTAYMVMEYLHGKTLMEILEQRGALPVDEVRRIARQMCAALQEVHDAGMLHRDIKPDNVMRCDDGRVVLVDFGLSETFDDGGSRATRPLDATLRFGTPGYAPLEQYTQSAQLGPSADIYALGATIYHLCSGKMPLPATDRAIGAELAPMHTHHPVFEKCVQWAMSMQPDKRPRSATALFTCIDEADQVLGAHQQILHLLQSRATQLLHQPAKSSADDTIEMPRDDTGCMKMAFIIYMSFWALVTGVWLIFVFVRYVLLGH